MRDSFNLFWGGRGGGRGEGSQKDSFGEGSSMPDSIYGLEPRPPDGPGWTLTVVGVPPANAKAAAAAISPLTGELGGTW